MRPSDQPAGPAERRSAAPAWLLGYYGSRGAERRLKMAHCVLSLHARYGIGDVALPQGRGTQLPYQNSLDVDRTVAHLVGSADFLHSLSWMAVAVGASDADAEE